jgi:hypothetical protein
MIRNSLIKIKGNYINLDRIVFVETSATSQGGTINFYLEKFQKFEFLFGSNESREYHKIINALDKKIITSSTQPPKTVELGKPNNVEEVIEYFKELKIKDAENSAKKFYNHYEGLNWYRGKTKIKKWKNCAKTWDFEKEPDEEEIEYQKARRALRR